MPGGSNPTWWGRFAMQPHRENPPRRQCRACAGGGDINGIRCRDCRGLGYHDIVHGRRQQPPPAPEGDAW